MDPVAWMEDPSYVDQIRLRRAHELRSQAYWEAVRNGMTLGTREYRDTTLQYNRILQQVQNHRRRESARRVQRSDRVDHAGSTRRSKR